jgi:hypothetical protein
MEMSMRDRMLAFIGSLAVGAAALGIASASIVAQTAKPPAKTKTSTPPRTHDGHPDLQGTYDVATMTPLERPRELGDRLVLTREEAAALEQYEQQRGVKNDEPIRGERKAPPVGGENTTPKSYLEFLEKAGGGPVGGYNNFWLAGGTQIITVNGQKRSSLIVDPPNGRVPALKPEAQKRNAALLARAARPDASESDAGPSSAFDGPEARPLAERCLLGFLSTAGPPTLPNYFYNNLKQIVQTPTSVMILNEMVHDARIVRIGGEHLPRTIRKWMGDSVGHWEGDTLVIDTTNFTDKTQFQGSSDQLHVVERLTRADANTLLYRFTIEDPVTWERSWTGEYPWVGTDDLLYEYACHEGNYALGDVLRGARVKEAEDAAKKSGKQ